MKILLAVDGSSPSQDAIDEVARRPWPQSSIIRVMSAVHPYLPSTTEFAIAAGTIQEVMQQHQAQAQEIVNQAASVVARSNAATETVVRLSDPRTAIVDEANDWMADLVVVGSHGRTGLGRLLLGSVAQSVVAHAPCSVEVVRRRGAR